MTYPLRSVNNDTIKQLELAASVFHHSLDGIMILARDGAIIAVNDAFTSITGYGEDEVIGRKPRILQNSRQSREFYDLMWEAIRNHGHWQGEIWSRRKDGSEFPERITITSVFEASGHLSHYFAVFADITSAHEKQLLLEQHSYRDDLTGLPNRVFLKKCLTQAMVRARDSSGTVGVAFIDLDGFKAVNDKFGHAAGDEVLLEMAKRLRNALRESDTLARFGGDEFVAVLPDARDNSALANLLERLLTKAQAPIDLNGSAVTLSASIGVAFFPQDGITSDELLCCADRAMYSVKRSARN